MTIRILIADDHAVVAEGLRRLLEGCEDMQVLGCVNNGREAVKLAVEERPDVIVMDSAMPELNGIEATIAIRAKLPNTRIVVLSIFADPIYIARAMRAGASGYIPKYSAARELLDGIRAVHAGRKYLQEPLARAVLDVLLDYGDVDPLMKLSGRERQVMQMTVESISTMEIARILSLSVKTVETYRSRGMEKLGLRDTVALVKFAVRHGLTPP